MPLTQYIGDSVTHHIPLRWGRWAFEPGVEWALLWTLKAAEGDTDFQAKIQKASGAGISVLGDHALVSLVPQDTDGSGSAPALPPTGHYWDIQAQHTGTGEVRTVAKGILTLVRDITRARTPSIPIFTTQPPSDSSIVFDPQIPAIIQHPFSLAAKTTASMPLNRVIAFVADGVLMFYQLKSGTDAQALPGIVRPIDYHASTNARVWKQVL